MNQVCGHQAIIHILHTKRHQTVHVHRQSAIPYTKQCTDRSNDQQRADEYMCRQIQIHIYIYITRKMQRDTRIQRRIARTTNRKRQHINAYRDNVRVKQYTEN